MIIKGDSRYVSELSKLWQEVFLDDEEYIKLFFDILYCETECFAKISNGKIVSALYLIKGQIKYNNQIFEGRYLYAAATNPSYRKQGIMAELINEAIEYVKQEKLDFICLLPANEGLYNYYAKFGFTDTMYKFKSITNYENKQNTVIFPIEKSLDEARKIIENNMFVFTGKGNDYALECLRYSGYALYNLKSEVGFECMVVADNKFKEIVELICKKENYDCAEKYLEKCFSDGSEISSPYKGSKGEKIRFGMIYPINEKLRCAEIYMNIALD